MDLPAGFGVGMAGRGSDAAFLRQFLPAVSDTLYGIFPYWIPALGILNWIASRTSEKVRS